jgi:hypothetical protein
VPRDDNAEYERPRLNGNRLRDTCNNIVNRARDEARIKTVKSCRHNEAFQ